MNNRLARNTRQFLVSVFGTAHWLNVLIVGVLLIMLGWAGDSLRDLLLAWTDSHGINTNNVLWMQVVAFAVTVLSLILLAGFYLGRLEYSIVKRPSVKTKGLVCYLSVLRKPVLDSIALALKRAKENPEKPVTIEEIATCAWHQPLCAIREHLDKLQKVAFICSASVPADPGQEKELNSHDQFPLFRELCAAFFGQTLEIIEAQESVDFQDIAALFDVTRKMVESLEATLGGIGNVTLDLTGGTKPTTIAGQMVAMTKGRVIQYVSNAGTCTLWDTELKMNQ